MKCIASKNKSEARKLKVDAVNNALEFVLTIVAYVLFDKFGMSNQRVTTILKRIEYYALIMLDDEEDMDLKDYKAILKEEYDFELKFRGK
ncbi:MAG: hypothetical protein J6Q94_01075 [Clostridia bacterium]|nr:hypothetical protein [Clostridia bacterium]